MSVRGIVFASPNEVVLRDDLRCPEPGPSDLAIVTTFTGVSVGTERNFLTGGSYELGFPQLAGYQIAGRVERVGDAVTRFAAGDRVFAHLFWSHAFLGDAFTWVGSHADRHVGSEEGTIVGLPDDIPDDEASLLSIAAIGLHGASRGGLGQGRRVLVFGLGMIGQFAAQAARASGASVVGVDRHAMRREAASSLGRIEVVDAGDPVLLWGRLRELGPFDSVIETTAGDDVIGRLVETHVLRDGARIVMLGGRRRLDYPFNRAQETELELVHSMHHSNEDIQDVLRLRREGRFAIGPLISHHLAPDEVAGFWSGVLAGDRDFLGVVIDWTRG